MKDERQNDIALLSRIFEIAEERFDGHVTLMKFTTGWKIMFGTPCMDGEEREMLDTRPEMMNLSQALKDAIRNHPSFWDPSARHHPSVAGFLQAHGKPNPMCRHSSAPKRR